MVIILLTFSLVLFNGCGQQSTNRDFPPPAGYDSWEEYEASQQSTPTSQSSQPESPSPTQTTNDKSDTEQVVDTVLSFMILYTENKHKDIQEIEDNEWDYWYGGSASYNTWWKEDKNHMRLVEHLARCVEQEEDGKAAHPLPTIQDNYASLTITLDRDTGFTAKKNVFLFNLKEDANAGWGITDIRLIETEEDLTQPMMPKLN